MRCVYSKQREFRVGESSLPSGKCAYDTNFSSMRLRRRLQVRVAYASRLRFPSPATGTVALLSRVMRRRRFRLGRFFGCFLIGLDPFGMKDAGLIDPFVSMRAKEIALGLQEIRG